MKFKVVFTKSAGKDVGAIEPETRIKILKAVNFRSLFCANLHIQFFGIFAFEIRDIPDAYTRKLLGKFRSYTGN